MGSLARKTQRVQQKKLPNIHRVEVKNYTDLKLRFDVNFIGHVAEVVVMLDDGTKPVTSDSLADAFKAAQERMNQK